MPVAVEKTNQQPLTPPVKKAAAIQVSPRLTEAARLEPAEVLRLMETSAEGLSSEVAAERLEQYGLNEVAREKKQNWVQRLYLAARNPLVILLTILAIVSFAAPQGDFVTGTIMLVMVVLGLSLRFIQETRADTAAAKLKAMISVTATVVRDAQPREVPLQQLVPGDVVKLCAGDMIPGDVRLISAKDLFVIQATLTGESMPVEKTDACDPRENVSPIEHANICFLGTSVETGSATGVIIGTGSQTYFGKMARSLAGQQVETAFDRGVKKFTWLMIRFMLVMVPLVFLINGLTKHDWHKAFFFSLAVAVGLTPEMLPMIVSVCLSKGALAMSKKKVIVKRLNSIQNFGAMDVLCTDKTGTLTLDHVILEIYCDVFKNENEEVLRDAYLISHFQTGLKNVLDRAVLQHQELHRELSLEKYSKVDEIPFDFSRRMMSVAVEGPGGERQLLTKGAPEAVFAKCTHFESEGEIFEMEPILVGNLIEQVNDLSEDGFRALAVATKKVEKRAAYSKADESDLVLTGYLAFLDPPKDTAAKAISALRQHGVAVKVLTGDNDLVTRKVCNEVGINAAKILLGSQVETMADDQLAEAVEATDVFARLSPAHKQRIVQALQLKGHVLGFMGDGINDAPALRAADIGISVDSAVDIAKEAADIILLEKSLMVLEQGVIEGRRTFSNMLKYIRMTASSNFGNVFSVMVASAFIPFLPMLPLHLLVQNLLYDLSQIAIPFDNVDDELVRQPLRWNPADLGRFMVFFGPISSLFDILTFALMWFVFAANTPEQQTLFQSGWFVIGLLTQTLIVHMIRTPKIPFLQSRPSWPLLLATAAVMAAGIFLPMGPLAGYFKLQALPAAYFPWMIAILLGYACLATLLKRVYIRRYGWQ